MQDWAKNYKQILENSGIRVMLLAGYVDDGRQLSSCLPMGYRFLEQEKTFEFQEQAEQEDKKRKSQGESTNERMARILLPAMNSINNNLEFTVETPEEFEQERLPTLDFTLWQEQDGTINHSYYQKQVKTPYVIMARSSMSTQQKIQILSNELTRRIGNINILKNGTQEYMKVIEQFTQELKNSEFQFPTAREIVISGIRGLVTRNKRREQKNQPIYRTARITAHQRAHKKLVAKENWYREPEENSTAPSVEARITSCPGSGKSRSLFSQTRKTKEHENNEKPKIKSVMFVPFTPGSQLAKNLRVNEEHLSKVSNNKIKIVERTGTKLVDLLTRSNPWKGADCERENCLICFTKQRTEKNKTQDCHQRNIVYETRCLTCQEKEQDKINDMDLTEHEKRELNKKLKLFKYIGESSRSTFERGWEHLNDMAQLRTSSHMLKHALTEHEEQDMGELKFGMQILRTCKSSFERQIHESVVIQQERKHHHILNSRSEYNRCSLPRISTKIGDNEYKKYSKEIEEEKKQEEKIEGKIRQLRKERNKARLAPIKGQSTSTKRRKINSTEYITIKETWGKPDKSKPVKNPAREQELGEQPPKKKSKIGSFWPASGSPSTGTPPLKVGTTSQVTQCQYINVNSGHERITNIRTIEKIIQVTEQNKDLEFGEDRDWEQVLREHRERIEREETEKNNLLERKAKKEDSWNLYNLCKNFLEENSEHWRKRREQQIEENSRLERLERAKAKSIEARIKERTKVWEKKLQEGLEKVPQNEKAKLESEQKAENLKELRTAKQSLWKLRSKEQKLIETEQVLAIRKFDKKTEQVLTLLDKEKNRLMEREKNARTAIKNNNKKDVTKTQKLLAEIWATYRWITEYLLETTEEWEIEKNLRTKQHQERLDNWDNKKRSAKIEYIKNNDNRELDSGIKSPSSLEPPVKAEITSCTGSEPLRSSKDVNKIVNTTPSVQAILPSVNTEPTVETVNTESTVEVEITSCTGMESLRSLNTVNKIVNKMPSVQEITPSANTVEDRVQLNTAITEHQVQNKITLTNAVQTVTQSCTVNTNSEIETLETSEQKTIPPISTTPKQNIIEKQQNMITNNSKSKKQPKINMFFNNEQSVKQQQQKQQLCEKEASPKPEKRTRKTTNNKKTKKQLVEEENKKLRGYWTKLAEKKKSKVSHNEADVQTLGHKQDFVFEGSPDKPGNPLNTGESHDMYSKTFNPNLPENTGLNAKVKLLENPRQDPGIVDTRKDRPD